MTDTELIMMSRAENRFRGIRQLSSDIVQTGKIRFNSCNSKIQNTDRRREPFGTCLLVATVQGHEDHNLRIIKYEYEFVFNNIP